MDNSSVQSRSRDLASGAPKLPPTSAREPESCAPAKLPKLSFGSWAITEDRVRPSSGEQCEANR